MKNKNGFIATSLIYSFFLVFIAILTSLLGNFIANKTIEDRFNEEAINSLNNRTSTFYIYMKGAIINGERAFANRIENSDFKYTDEIETETGTSTIRSHWIYTNIYEYDENIGMKINFDNKSTEENTTKTEYTIDQDITNILEKGHKYYLAVNYTSTLNNGFVHIKKNNSDYFLNINLKSTEGNIERESSIFTIEEDLEANETYSIQIGIPKMESFTTEEEFGVKNVLLIDLTEKYESNVPRKDWLDKHISYFSENIYYKNFDNVRVKDIVSIDFSPIGGVEIKGSNIKCQNSSGEDISYVPYTDDTTEPSYELNTEKNTLSFKNIKENTTCYIDWSGTSETE